MTNDNILQLRPNPGPEELPPEPPWALILIGIVALGMLAVLAWYAWRWWRRRRRVPPLPHVTALAELDRLAGMKFNDAVSADRFYVLVTDVLRRYVRARFHVEAPGRTTRELVQAFEGIAALSPAQRAAIAGVLARADLVKFAKECPSPEATERFTAEIRQFIGETAT